MTDFLPTTELQEVNTHGVRIKEEEEPMEVNTLVVSNLVLDRPITKEVMPLCSMESHHLFNNKTEDKSHSGNKMAEQLHLGAKMADQRLHGLKTEDKFYAESCQPGSTATDNLVSSVNTFQFRVKMEDHGDLSGAKMEVFETKIAEQPLSIANLSNKFPSGAKMEDQFSSGAKMEDQPLFGTKMENRLLPGAKMVDHVFSGAKTEEQLFFGAKMEDQFTSGAKMADQCLRAVLWQDMSVNLASTLLHQLSGKAHTQTHTHTLTLLIQFHKHVCQTTVRRFVICIEDVSTT